MGIKTKLDEICTIKGRIGYRGYAKQDLVKEGDGAISLSPSNIINNKLIFKKTTYISWKKYEESPEIMIYPGDIIFCKTASIGKMALIDSLPEKATLNPQFVVLKNIKCLNKFLFYCMMSNNFQKQIQNIIGGTAIPTLSQKNLGETFIFLPPKKEQQRIVAKLDVIFAEIDKAIELTKKSISNFKSYYAYTIDKEFFKYSDKLRQIRDYSKINYGYTAKANFNKGGYKLLRITDIQNNSVDWNTVPYCNVEPNKLSSVILKHGDIVFARTGATTGKSFLIQNPVNSVFASYLIRISVDREILLPTFVIYYFQSAKYWKQVNDGISGSAQGGFNSSKLSQLRIPIISKTNQQKLVEKFDLINDYSLKLQDYYSRKLIHLHSLKQAILSKELIRKKAA